MCSQHHTTLYIAHSNTSILQVATVDTLPLYNYCPCNETTPTIAMETNDLTTPSIVSEMRVGEIRDPLDDGFTVRLNSGQLLRSSITQLYRHSTGEKQSQL